MIPITKPYFGEEELAAVQKPLESGWVVQGPFVHEFEERFGSFTGAPFSVATSSGTTALHLAVAAIGVGPGDEVIVPAFTWISTANVIEHMGAKPVFCDIDLATFNLDPAQVADAVTERSVGIIPVHLFGLSADLDPLLKLARDRDLWVVEDAACALGARYRGEHVGTFGDAGCFSFHPRKSITTGEGGMITTSRRDLDSLARSLRDHGAAHTDANRGFLLDEYPHLGFNFRLTDIQAALGCAQMDRAEWILDQRRKIASRYDAFLAEMDWLQTPVVPKDCLHGYQAYVCLFRPEEPSLENVEDFHLRRNEVMDRLDRSGIATRQGTHAAFLQRLFVEKYGFRAEDFPNAYIADRLSLALPLFPQLTEEEQRRVTAALNE